MIILELGPLKSMDTAAPTERKANALGARLLRRLVDNWWRWDETFEVYRTALGLVGHKGRSADVFGTAIACADLILHDHVPEASDAKAWAEKLAAPALAELQSNDSDEQACWQHLIATVVEPFRSGGRRTIGEWIARAQGTVRTADGNMLTGTQIDEAAAVLQTYGLRLVDNVACVKLYGCGSVKDLPAGIAPPYLAVANSHPAVAQIYAGTHWAGKSGANGVWVQALRRLEGAVVPPRPLWLSGSDATEIRSASHRVTLIPLTAASAQGDGTSPDTGAQQILGARSTSSGEPDAAAEASHGDGGRSYQPDTTGEGDELPPL